ncbi:MAG: hypothetical protein N3D73_03305, partial [Candidatus Diapherotrites archaeon]|nr:hypothetical protein [Candidatus Diapherotrites archaeon]
TLSYGKGGYDAWILKIDSFGKLLWEKTFGGKKDDGIKSIVKTKDGNFLLARYTSSKGKGGYDAWILKIDSSGKLLWEKTFGGIKDDEIYDVLAEEDGGFIFVGGTSSKGEGSYDLWALKIDSSGNILWEKTFGGKDWDWGKSVIKTDYDSYIIIASTKSKGAGNYDLWILKLDSKGNLLWEKTFGGVKWDDPEAIIKLNKFEYIIV